MGKHRAHLEPVLQSYNKLIVNSTTAKRTKIKAARAQGVLTKIDANTLKASGPQ